MRPTVLTLLRNSRAALWAALLSLALFQAAAVGHAAEHAAEELGESCEFCLKVEETKASFVDNGSVSALPWPAAALDPTTRDADSTATPLCTPIRAPPALV